MTVQLQPQSPRPSQSRAPRQAGAAFYTESVNLFLTSLAVFVAGALIATGLHRRRARRREQQSQRIHAVSGFAATVQTSIVDRGNARTNTVRLEPHPDGGTSTVEEIRP